MSIDSIKYRAQSAFAGDLTRPNAPFTVMPKIAAEAIAFGAAVVEVAGQVRKVLASDGNISGFALRSGPKASKQYPNALVNEGGYVAGEVVDLIKDGYVAVVVAGTTEPVAGGTVWIRISGTGTVGAIEAAADGAHTIEAANAKFNTGRDANGIAEIHVAIV